MSKLSHRRKRERRVLGPPRLDSPPRDLDLDLVLQPFSSASQTQANDLVAAAGDGSVEKVGIFKPYTLHPTP